MTIAAATPPLPQDNWATVFGALPIGAFRSLPSGQFICVNLALARMHGFETEAELIAAVSDLAVDWYVQPQRRREILELLEREGSARGLVSEIYHQHTRRRLWISENAYVIRDERGQVVGYEGTLEDVTDRVRAHRALERHEALLRDVTAHMPGLVYRLRVTPGGGLHYEFVSDGVRQVYGVEPEAVLADPTLLARLRHPDDDARVRSALREHIAGKPLNTLEFRIRTPGGEEKWVRLTSALRHTPDHAPRLHGVVLDVTAEKRAEQVLRDTEARWKTAMETLGDGVWDWDLAQGQCVMSGPLREAYDLPTGAPSLAMSTFDSRVHPDDQASQHAARWACLDGQSPMYVHEHRLQRREGGWVWVLSRGVVVRRDAEGRPLRMIGTHTDITERREAETLRLQRDRAEAADRAKSELMSRISHELRTPLNAILGFGQLLDAEAEPGTRQQQWTAELLKGGWHLLGLVEDVLDLTRGQSLQLALHPEPVPLLEAFDASWAMLARQAQADRIALVPLQLEPSLAVQADAKRLRQVLTNLLSNAVKYNRPGGRIGFDAEVDGPDLVFTVTDTGRGIGAEHLPRIFHPFERLGAAQGPVAGVGLGLALCKQLVEAMAGSIAVASEAGVGTCVTVRLPRAA